ncbi:hypothetical protein M2132_000730 [Dysgonomonas sp. PH5-45]|uniref:hypothetical protein n=1 Tax=unclassified Dysgonomonas TaxID=2630389 RepID=UPI0024769A9A|nr:MULTISPECIES: hypothetical protein [unclassified Dysgonomonas]MDH6354402.1 hypothetical protein [Dysgonomonas sp. PH5-45]MDH6387301.1 hypothetical protein [Dysgonomonas sp. PH5-37]
MKKSTFIFYAAFFLMAQYYSCFLQAQATIGSSDEPNKGSLLDLKERSGVNENSTKGLLLPRVNLEDINELYPMFEKSDVSYNATEKKKHTGLLVYNLTDSPPKKLCPGVYSWSSAEWIRIPEPCSFFEFLCHTVADGQYTEYEGNVFAIDNYIFYKSIIDVDIESEQTISYGDGLHIIVPPQKIVKSEYGFFSFYVYVDGSTPSGNYELPLSNLNSVLGVDITGSCVINVNILAATFSIDCTDISTAATVNTYMDRTVQVPYNVSSVPYTVSAGNIGGTVNGITPSIAVDQELNTNTGYITVTLKGTPTSVGNTSIPITIGESTCNVTVDVSNTFAINCTGASTTATVDTYMNKTVQVSYAVGDVPHTVSAGNIGGTVNGITPSIASAQTLTDKNGYITVTLQGTPTSSGTTHIPITIDGSTCNVAVNVSNTFALNCTGVSTTATVNAYMSKTVQVPYTVGSVPYTVAAGYIGSVVNGIIPSIASNQTLTAKKGYVTVTLQGVPTIVGNTYIPITIGGSTCNVAISVANTFALKCGNNVRVPVTLGTTQFTNYVVNVPYELGAAPAAGSPYVISASTNIGGVTPVNGVTPSIATRQELTAKTGYIKVTLNGKPTATTPSVIPITINGQSCYIYLDITTPVSLNIICPATAPIIGGVVDKALPANTTVSIPYQVSGGTSYKLTGTTVTNTEYNITATIASQTLSSSGTITVTITGTPSKNTNGLVTWFIPIGAGEESCGIRLSFVTPPPKADCDADAYAFVFQQNGSWYAVGDVGKVSGVEYGKVYGPYATEEEALRHPEALQYCAYTTGNRCVSVYKRDGTRIMAKFFSVDSYSDVYKPESGRVAFSSLCTNDMYIYPGGKMRYEFNSLQHQDKKGDLGVVTVNGVKYLGLVPTGSGGTMTTKPLMW